MSGMTDVTWEWDNAPPSKDDVMASLRSVPKAYGVALADYAAFVLPMPKKQKRIDDSGRQTEVMVWKLYMQVAGRLAMLNAAAAKHKWRVDFEPEPFIMGEKFVVYREYCAIYVPAEQREEDGTVVLGNDRGWLLMGRRPGMAAMKSGGYVPPIEKMETAARGRALGAWGFGVIPGSGVASLDEMELAAIPDFKPGEGGGDMPTRTQMEERSMIAMERIRQAKGETGHERQNWLRGRALAAFGKEVAMDDEGVLDFKVLKDPQMFLLMQFAEKDVDKARRTLGGT